MQHVPMGFKIFRYTCGKLGDCTTSESIIHIKMILKPKTCLKRHGRFGIVLTYNVKQAAISAVHLLFIVFKVATAAL